MASVKKHLPILKLVQTAKPELRKRLILHAGSDFINTIDECIYNTLKGNIPLKKNEIAKLKKFKKVLRQIFNSDRKPKKTKNIIIQSGGAFLPVLLSPIVTAAEKVFN